MPAATGIHLPRSLTKRSSHNRPEKASRLRGDSHSAHSHAPISPPLPLDTPLPTVPASMHNRQPLSRKAHKSVKRSQISGPIQLLSTTNELAYTSPDLKTMGMGMSSDALQSTATTTAAAAATATGSGSGGSAMPVPMPSALALSRTTSHSEEPSLISDTFSTGNESLDSPLASPALASPIDQGTGKQCSGTSSLGSYSEHDHRAVGLSSNHHHAHAHAHTHGHGHGHAQWGQSSTYGMKHSHTFPLTDNNATQPPPLREPSHSGLSKSTSQTSLRGQSTGRARNHSKTEHERDHGYEPHHTSPSSPQMSGCSSPAIATDHPFFRELAQVKEVAEEFGTGFSAAHAPASTSASNPTSARLRAKSPPIARPTSRRRVEEELPDDRFLQSKGLKAFRASEYLTEIEDFHASPYDAPGLSPYAENTSSNSWF